MTVAVLPRRGVAPLPPPPEDRWQGPRAARRSTVATAIVLLASLLVHAAVVVTALLPEAAAQAPTEIPVEVVTEPAEPETSAGPAKPDLFKPEAAKPEAAKPEAAKSEAAPSGQPTVPQAAKPPEPPPAPAKPDAAAELKTLRDELANLKAEDAARDAEMQAEAPPAGTPADASPAAAPLQAFGPLPDSFQAAALPGESGEGEAYGYAAIVFSQLAKAKEIGGRLGEPGTAGVRFTVDERGGLASVALAVSSGIGALDEEAVAIVRKAAPFPPPPEGAQRSFEANVSFVGAGR